MSPGIGCRSSEGRPNRDDLKVLCAALDTTAAAAMLHLAGVTRGAEGAALPKCVAHRHRPHRSCCRMAATERGSRRGNLMTIAAPMPSVEECRTLVLDGLHPDPPGARIGPEPAPGAHRIAASHRGCVRDVGSDAARRPARQHLAKNAVRKAYSQGGSPERPLARAARQVRDVRTAAHA